MADDKAVQATEVAEKVTAAAQEVAEKVEGTVHPVRELLLGYTIGNVELWDILVLSMFFVLTFYILYRVYIFFGGKRFFSKKLKMTVVTLISFALAYVLARFLPQFQGEALKIVFSIAIIFLAKQIAYFVDIKLRKAMRHAHHRISGGQIFLELFKLVIYSMMIFVIIGFYHDDIGNFLQFDKVGLDSEWIFVVGFAALTPVFSKAFTYFYLLSKHVGYEGEWMEFDAGGSKGLVVGKITNISLLYVTIEKIDGMPMQLDINCLRQPFENFNRRKFITIDPWLYYVDTETPSQNLSDFIIAIRKMIMEREDCDLRRCRREGGSKGYYCVSLLFQVSARVNNLDNIVNSIARSIDEFAEKHQVKLFSGKVVV